MENADFSRYRGYDNNRYGITFENEKAIKKQDQVKYKYEYFLTY